jgi:putative transposase
MSEDDGLKAMGQVIQIDEARIRDHLGALERIMKEIRRRTRVVGAFPDGQSCLNMVAARLRHIAGTTWSAKCYMNMRPLYQQQLSETEAVA